MHSIRYSINGCEPRTMRVPNQGEARWHASRWGGPDRLDQFILAHGTPGIEKFCRECFTWANTTLLEIHDGTGCVVKLI